MRRNCLRAFWRYKNKNKRSHFARFSVEVRLTVGFFSHLSPRVEISTIEKELVLAFLHCLFLDQSLSIEISTTCVLDRFIGRRCILLAFWKRIFFYCPSSSKCKLIFLAFLVNSGVAFVVLVSSGCQL